MAGPSTRVLVVQLSIIVFYFQRFLQAIIPTRSVIFGCYTLSFKVFAAYSALHWEMTVLPPKLGWLPRKVLGELSQLPLGAGMVLC